MNTAMSKEDIASEGKFGAWCIGRYRRVNANIDIGRYSK